MTTTIMKKRLITLITFILVMNFSLSFGQDERSKIPIKDRIFIGGNLGLQFGSTTYIDISPIIGYKITEKFHAGIGVTYSYIDTKAIIYNSIVKYNSSNYGGRVFGRYFVWQNAFAYSEFEFLNIGIPVYNTATNDVKIFRENVPGLYIGGGYAQPIGENAALIIMGLYNLIEDQYSPDQNPIFRIGFSAGF